MRLSKMAVALIALLALGGSALAATVTGEVYTPAIGSVNMATNTVTTMIKSGGVFQSRISTVFDQMIAANDDFSSNSAMASAYMNSNLANRIWATPFYSSIDAKNRGGQHASGYDYDLWGVALGYDRIFGNFMMGAAVTYSRGDYDAKNVHDDTKVDNYGASVYAGYYSVCTGFFGNVYGGYNYGDNNIRVNNAGVWGRATPHTDSYWLGATLGYDFKVSECFKLTPTVGLQWIDASTSSFSMSGTRYGKFKEKSLLLPIDIAATYTAQIDDCSSVQFKVSGGYAYDFKKDGAKGSIVSTATPQTFIRGSKPGRHNWNVGAGLKYVRRQYDVGVDYRYDGRKNENAHTVSATVGINF